MARPVPFSHRVLIEREALGASSAPVQNPRKRRVPDHGERGPSCMCRTCALFPVDALKSVEWNSPLWFLSHSPHVNFPQNLLQESLQCPVCEALRPQLLASPASLPLCEDLSSPAAHARIFSLSFLILVMWKRKGRWAKCVLG